MYIVRYHRNQMQEMCRKQGHRASPKKRNGKRSKCILDQDFKKWNASLQHVSLENMSHQNQESLTIMPIQNMNGNYHGTNQNNAVLYTLAWKRAWLPQCTSKARESAAESQISSDPNHSKVGRPPKSWYVLPCGSLKWQTEKSPWLMGKSTN